MNTPTPPDPHDDPKTGTDHAAPKESLVAQVKRWVHARTSGKITVLLNANIAFLRKIRLKNAGPKMDVENGGGPEAEHVHSLKQALHTVVIEDESEAPKPEKRLRAFLIYGSVMLVSGLGGGALAYTLFQKQLGHHLKEVQRLNAELAKRSDAEAKLATALTAAAENKKQLDAANQQLSKLLKSESADHPGSSSFVTQPNRYTPNRQAKSGDCTLNAKNIDSLKKCIQDFNQ